MRRSRFWRSAEQREPREWMGESPAYLARMKSTLVPDGSPLPRASQQLRVPDSESEPQEEEGSAEHRPKTKAVAR
jgi:hypothetical protein